MSYSSNSSGAGFCTNKNNRGRAYSSKKYRKKINKSFRELSSDDSDDSKEHVNKLTTLVRETYLSYLIKILSYNYKSISTNKSFSERFFSARDIKECAEQMEEKALLSSVEAGLYQRAMLRVVAEIKQKTENKELHGKLYDYSQLYGDKGTQTESFLPGPPQSGNKEAPRIEKPLALFPGFITNSKHKYDIRDLSTRSPINPSEISHWPQNNMKQAINNLVKVNKHVLPNRTMSESNKSPEDLNFTKSNECLDEESLFHPYSESDECPDYDEEESPLELAPSIKTKSSTLEVANGQFPKATKVQIAPKQSLDERLAALNFDRSTTFALGEFSPEKANDEHNDWESKIQEDKATEKSRESPGLSSLDKQLAEIHGESEQQRITKTKEVVKRKKKLVWRYEEIYYTKRLNLKLKSLSTAKRVKLEHRFNELFVVGNNASKKPRIRPVVEDPLLEYKDRIKPWVVKHLMPYYKNGKIDSRDFFKHIARHITDSLVEVNHLPDETDVIDSVDLLFNTEDSKASKEENFNIAET